MPQVAVEVRPTRTIYPFENHAVRVELTFLEPAVPYNLDMLASPVTYLSWRVESRDGSRTRSPSTSAPAANLAVHSTDQEVAWSREATGPVKALKLGHEGPAGPPAPGRRHADRLGLSLPGDRRGPGRAGRRRDRDARRRLREDRRPCPRATTTASPAGPTTRRRRWPWPSRWARRGRVRRAPPPSCWPTTTFTRSITWATGSAATGRARNRARPSALLLLKHHLGLATFDSYCAFFDRQLAAVPGAGRRREVRPAGRARPPAVARRGKLVADANGHAPLVPEGEHQQRLHRHGRRDLPAVPPPAAPQPALAKASIVPVLDYAASPRWKFPFAPHDLGTYPAATGQVYGGGERTEENQMPVEESGNMLIMVAAIAQVEKNADFAAKYWPQLTQWAKYCEDHGFDPANQLCTDDFAGHLARNANLSVKAILGLACLRQARRHARRPGDGRPLRRAGPDPGGKWRPWPTPATTTGSPSTRRRLEPEVQPGLGPDPRPQGLPRGGRPQGAGLLPDGRPEVRPAARLAEEVHQERLAGLDGHPGARPGDVRAARRAALPVRERDARPRPVLRLLLDRQRPARRDARPPGHRRRLHPAARPTPSRSGRAPSAWPGGTAPELGNDWAPFPTAGG